MKFTYLNHKSSFIITKDMHLTLNLIIIVMAFLKVEVTILIYEAVIRRIQIWVNSTATVKVKFYNSMPFEPK